MHDVRAWIAADSAAKHGGFVGAVFLTYSLNLNFFEQIIAPALDRAGCANVLIITDPDGYASVLDLGACSLTGVGRRYVVAPLRRRGAGIQHAKMLLMAGEKRGRLMIGSGNLTHNGYGRNMELVTCFDYDVLEDTASGRYAFTVAWQLARRLADDGYLTSAAWRQVGTLSEKASWLNMAAEPPEYVQVWHNYETPILSQLQFWQAQRTGGTGALRELYVIAPYYDRDVSTFRRLHEQLAPESLRLWVDPQAANLNGQRLAQVWHKLPGAADAFSVQGLTKKGASRSLHAKALIGIEESGAWCLTGSANISRPAMQRTWLNGGNLELVTCHWQPSAGAFSYLLAEPNLIVTPIDVSTVTETVEEPSERPLRVATPLAIVEATLHNSQLQVTLSAAPPPAIDEKQVQFLRSDREMSLPAPSSSRFSIELEQPLTGVEAICVKLGDILSPYCWIDQPAELDRFGARAYYQRVKGQIETFDGAAQLFEELLNYLWERVDPEETRTSDDDDKNNSRRPRRRPGQQSDGDGVPEPPPAADFISEELLVDSIHWAIDGQFRYDRSVLSLRELLSLVLLRLTAPTQLDADTVTDGPAEYPKPGSDERTVKVVRAQEAPLRPGLLQTLRTSTGRCRLRGENRTLAALSKSLHFG